MKPQARTDGLVVRDLPGEVVVYDRVSHQAHCLNRTAAIVFRNADGRRTVGDLARLLAAETGTAADHAVVSATLDRLRDASLLEACVDDSSRREVMRRVGLGAAALLPIVTSILVPSPAEAANTCIPKDSCPGNTQQPCYDTNPAAECPTNKCTGFQICA